MIFGYEILSHKNLGSISVLISFVVGLLIGGEYGKWMGLVSFITLAFTGAVFNYFAYRMLKRM